MPSRVIRGDINSSDSLSRVSMQAEFTFRALITVVDDYGRTDARLPILKAVLFPMRETVTTDDIERWLAELDQEGCVRLYSVGGRQYLTLTGWEKHRGTTKRAKKSRFPSPEACSSNTVKTPGENRGIRGSPSEKGSREKEVESRAPGRPRATHTFAEHFPPDAFPGFELRDLGWYEARAAPTEHPRACQLGGLQVAEWHAWQWFVRGVADGKPRGVSLALRNRWRRLDEFQQDELETAHTWCEGIRHEKRMVERRANPPLPIRDSQPELRILGEA